MQFENFKQYIVDHVKDFLPVEYEESEVSITAQRKNNNVFWDALTIKGKSNVVPVIYLESYYHHHVNGRSMENILQEIANVYVESMKQAGQFSTVDFQYDKIKDNIFVAVQNAEMNKEFLKDVPHEVRDDLALLYRVGVTLSGGEKGSVIVNNSHLKMWGIDENTLKEVAWSNMHDRYRPVFSSIGSVLEELGFEELQEESKLVEMYVLTNKEKTYGAAYMFDEEVMSKIADRFGTDIVVIPSSVHETLLLKWDSGMDLKALQKMVQDVNRTQLQTIEILSDSVYQYNRETQTLSRIDVPGQTKAMMPDKVSVEEMHGYGYTWDGMLPLTEKRALELMDTELQVYKLHTDGSEGVVKSIEEVYAHDGMFGVEKEAWFAYQNSQNQVQVGEMTQGM